MKKIPSPEGPKDTGGPVLPFFILYRNRVSVYDIVVKDVRSRLRYFIRIRQIVPLTTERRLRDEPVLR
jgi:hypothetical protein